MFQTIFTRGQLWPSGIVVACVCVCVCLSVNHQLVRAITHQLFKLESPNLDQRCKRPWLRSLLFLGTIDLELQGQIELKSKNLPHFELVRAISHHQLKSVFPNFGQKWILALLRSLLNLGWIDPWCSVSFLISNLFILPKFASHYSFASVCIYLVRPSPVSAAHSTWHRTYTDSFMYADSVAPWTVKQSSLYLGGTIGVQWAVDSAIGTGFYKLPLVLVKLDTPHMP